jgi:adenine nucleotide transporter 17
MQVINTVVSGEKHISPIKNLAVASIAGVVNVLLTSPLWTICVQIMRVKKGRTPGVIEHGTKIVKEEGFWSLWNGVIPSLWLVSNPSVQFLM